MADSTPPSSSIEWLRREATALYGADRVAEAPFQAALDAAASALDLVAREPLSPGDEEPFAHA